MERGELAAWLRLVLSDGVGNGTARKLLACFGLPDRVFRQPRATLLQVVTQAQATSLACEPPELPALTEATWNWLHSDPQAQGGTRRILTLSDPDYPAALLEIEDPPLMLYLTGMAHGDLAATLANCIAVVGSRNPTPQGAINARDFARVLAQAGLTVVSGLALGVDGAAHRGALEGIAPASTQLATVAVVGTGLDRVYPKSHLALAHVIAQRGLLLSEYPIGTPPLAANFPRRNRIIAALSRGTLVVEAALQSGSLITARLAAEQGREVFAIPGSIHSTQSRGCHALIKQGAKLVESAQDILEELQPGLPAAPLRPADATAPAPGPHGASVLHDLGHDPVGLDALLARTGLDTATLQAQLMELELAGLVARLPGGLFQRIVTA